MSRFKLLIEFAGTRYSGWQIQKNARTIQGELTRATSAATGVAEFELYGAGRTDAGVHALGQVAHLDLAVNTPPEILRRQINEALPSDINILVVEKVPHRFHARHDALARSYLYQISRRRTAFAKSFVWWVKDDLHVRAMRETARALAGRHDFRSFTDEDPELTSTLVEVESLELKEAGDLVLIRITGSHFVWKMVRRIVGVLVEVGRGQLRVGQVQGFLTERSEVPARLTAPASGLFLERVFYEGDRRDLPLVPAVPLTFCVLAHSQAPSSALPPEPA
jgi:tRNA pseudouridine38-40 synthase